MEKQKVYHKPTAADLIIPGMLSKIKVHYNSFSVFYQFEGFEKFEHQLIICENVYPISYLVQFFKVNGSAEKNYFVIRPKELLNN
ncbi:hypothetical protein ABMY20_15290 [Tenacibaculum sp. SSH1-16]|uniref:hypothetical protein n=1 Tax=Tenacibaculum sp. SSH1-16 TaxID=3136667 RepID=UPI0032C49FD1